MANDTKRPAAPATQLRLSIPPDPRLGGYVRQEVLAFALAQGVGDENIADLLAAVGEALANAIEHAGTCEPIEISAWRLDDRLFASVCDRGVGFAANERLNAASGPDVLAERGRGLLIMRRFADAFSVRSAPGEGTRVTLGCRINRPAGQRLDSWANQAG